MRYLVAFVVAAAVWTQSAAADVLVESPGTGGWRTHSDGSVGFNFTVTGTNLTVTALGFIDKDLDGLATSHNVGIWLGGRTDGTTTASDPGPQLATVNVGSGTSATLIDGYRYVDLTAPIVLEVGKTYTIGAQTDTAADQFISSGNTADFTSYIANTVSRYSWFEGSSVMPRNYDAGSGLMAPNMIFSVPEPTVIAPLTLASLSLLARRRRAA